MQRAPWFDLMHSIFCRRNPSRVCNQRIALWHAQVRIQKESKKRCWNQYIFSAFLWRQSVFKSVKLLCSKCNGIEITLNTAPKQCYETHEYQYYSFNPNIFIRFIEYSVVDLCAGLSPFPSIEDNQCVFLHDVGAALFAWQRRIFVRTIKYPINLTSGLALGRNKTDVTHILLSIHTDPSISILATGLSLNQTLRQR